MIIFLTEDLSFPIDEGMKKFNYELFRYLDLKGMTYRLFTGPNNDLPVDYCLRNKSFLSISLCKKIRQLSPDFIIYSPLSSGTFYSFFRLFLIKIYYRKSKTFLINLQHRKHSWFTRYFIRLTKPDCVIAFSKGDSLYYSNLAVKVINCKSGVDIDKFKPVNEKDKFKIRQKFGFSTSKKIILHIGHIRRTRNISVLKGLPEMGYTVLVAGSTSTIIENDFRNELEASGIKTKHEYVRNIEELYQMADIYVFPVTDQNSAIEFPLSVLEAMSCNIPVVTTRYGALPDMFEENECFSYFANQKELFNKIDNTMGNTGVNNQLVRDHFSWDIVFYELLNKIRSL